VWLPAFLITPELRLQTNKRLEGICLPSRVDFRMPAFHFPEASLRESLKQDNGLGEVPTTSVRVASAPTPGRWLGGEGLDAGSPVRALFASTATATATATPHHPWLF